MGLKLEQNQCSRPIVLNKIPPVGSVRVSEKT